MLLELTFHSIHLTYFADFPGLIILRFEFLSSRVRVYLFL